MKNLLKKFCTLIVPAFLVMLVSGNLFAQAPPVDTLLNGKIFTIKLEEDMGKKNKSYDDEWLFKGDKLKSKKFLTEGQFKAGKFKASLDPNSVKRKINFECTLKNADGEEIIITGSVTENEIEGTIEWNKSNGSTKMMYNLSGAIKEKKVPGQKKKKEEE